MAIRKKAFKKDLLGLYDYVTIDEQPFSDGFFNVVDFPEKLKAGKNLGHKTINGKLMFIYQAHASFNIWHNIYPEINDEVMNLLGT